jgi:hypothetical protein
MAEQTPQDYFKGFPEAPASDTFKWVDAQGFEHMTTIRAWTATALQGEVVKFTAKIAETGGKTAALPTAPKPATAKEQPVADANGTMSASIAKIKVTPEVKDGKKRILVEMFEANHQWADIKAFFNDPNQAAAAFSGVTQLDFSEAGEYQINFTADYRNSDKLNTKGKPYKNFVNAREGNHF